MDCCDARRSLMARASATQEVTRRAVVSIHASMVAVGLIDAKSPVKKIIFAPPLVNAPFCVIPNDVISTKQVMVLTFRCRCFWCTSFMVFAAKCSPSVASPLNHRYDWQWCRCLLQCGCCLLHLIGGSRHPPHCTFRCKPA